MELLGTLPDRSGKRMPLSAMSIHRITTDCLKAHGITQYTAHSTRGAGATALIHKGVSPAVVQSLGDWKSGDTFNFFYNRVRALEPFQQVLIP